jgi:subtilisin-like proprotein convertase family protein
VVISTDNGVTWTSANTLRLWNNSGSTNVYNNISNTGELVIINLSAYTGVVKIGLYGESTVSNADNDLTIDNFIVRTIPSCPQPSALTATNILPNQAQLSWTENGSAIDWDIEYGPLGFVQGSGTTISATTNNPYTLTGLTASNTFSYYVRSKCGSSTYSNWTGPFTFTTPCNAVTTFPWSENFEVLTIPALPSCWHKESGEWESTNNSNNTYDADAHNGTQFIKESYSATNEYIWTLGFSLTAGISYDFSFWWAGDNYAGWTGDVFYNTTQNSTGAIQLGSSFVTASTTTTKDYAQVVRTFTPSVSGTYYFAVRVNATITPWYLSLDDFGLELTSLCAQPTNINVSNITETTAVLNWTAASPPPASGYQYYCSSSSIPPTAATIPTGSTAAGVTTANITGLTMLTTYHVWVRSKCTSTSSSWIGPISFYTPDLSCVTALNFTGSSTIPEFDNGIYYFNVCNNTTLTLKANATPTCGTCTNVTYKWQINAYNGLGPVDYTSNPLNYPINQASGYDGLLIVKIGDAGHVCEARYPFRIRSSGNAVINSISATINGCAGNSTPISIGGTGSQIQVTPHTSTFTASMGSGATTFIPDGPDCTTRCYESTVAFTDFPIASTITSAADILYLKMNLEHSFIGDVQISLVCPNGSSAIILQDYFNSLDGGLDNSSYTWPHMSGLSHTRIGFGSPGIADISNPTNPCNSAASVNLPGTGWDYCWSNNSAYSYASGNAYVYEAANMTYYSSIPNYRVNKSDVANRSNFYHPFQNFSSLIGCPLNGTWKVKVCDSWREDNGWIFNWELALDGSLMPSPWSYEVPVDHVNWNLGTNATTAGPTGTNPMTYTLIPSPSLTTGSYTGNFTIVDDYGCQSTAAINYTVNGIPAIAGIATDDYLWTGYNSIDWNGANKFNWMKKTATGYVGADFTPTSTSNVFVLDNCGIGDGPTIVDNVSCKNLTIVNGTLTLASGKTLSISGNLKNLSTFIVSPNSTVVFNGASTQTIQSGGTNFYNMQVNNSGSGLQLVSDLIVSNALTMNQGNINAGSYTLAIGTSTSSRGTLNHTSGAVFGKLKRWFASGTNSGDASGLFPVGNSALSTQYVPALIEYTASPTGGSLTAEVKNENMGLTTGFFIAAINSCDTFTTTLDGGPAYWQFTAANGLSGGTYDVSLYPNGFHTINSLCELTALKRPTSGTWGVHGTHVQPSGTIANPIVKRTGVTTGFSDWGIGSSKKNPLPVELLYFKAECKDAFALLTWQTATENNNNYFTVEKSNNGIDFIEVKKINGAGNSNNPLSYSAIDDHIYPGITYYRLKQTDYNGMFSYSDQMAVNCAPALNNDVIVYPNPFTSKINISFGGEVSGNIQYCIYNAIGGKVVCGEIQKNMLTNNIMILDLQQLSDGVYNLQLIVNNKLYNTKIVK